MHSDGMMNSGMVVGMGLWWFLLLVLITLGIVGLGKYIFGHRG